MFCLLAYLFIVEKQNSSLIYNVYSMFTKQIANLKYLVLQFFN
jgi:hypothetical protein